VTTAPAPTLPELLARAYGARHRLEGDKGETWEDLVLTIACAGFSRVDLETRVADFAAFDMRCTVSATQRKALEAALELMPPA
jgi:hypothetical protein